MTEWSRWGRADEQGAANVLDSEVVKAAVAEVSTGQIVRLDTPIKGGAGFGLVGRPNPVHLMMRDGGDYASGLPERGGFGFADDVLNLPTQSVTHIDSLAHVWRDGLMYNGIPSTAVNSRGASKLGVDKIPPIVTRGVFVDASVGRYRSAADPIHLEELQHLLVSSGLVLRAGDALFIRTSWMTAALSGEADATSWAGLHSDCATWLADQDIVLLGADNPGVEVFPSGDDQCQVPLHLELICKHGIYLVELLDLDRLAATGRSSFMFVVAALPLVGGVGSPVVPLALL